MADPTIYDDPKLFNKPVTFAAEVTFSQTPPEISLDNLADLTGSGKATFADLEATDDLIVGDDASIGGDLAVTGNYTSAAGSITLTTGTVTAADVTTTDDVVVGDDLTVNGAATVAETLGVTGVVTPSAGFGGTGPGVPRVIAGAFTLTDIKAGSKTGDAVDSYARLLAEPPPDPVEAATRFLLSALPPLRG